MKESKYSLDSRVIFRETFNSQDDVNKNGGTLGATATISNGQMGITATTSVITYPKLLKGTFSVRIKTNQNTQGAFRYLIELGTGGANYIAINASNNVQANGTPIYYVNGVATAACPYNTNLEIVISGVAWDNITFNPMLRIGSAGFPPRGTIDLIEIYQGTLTATEVASLYKNELYKAPRYLNNQLLGTQFEQGNLTEKVSKTGFTVTGTPLFKDTNKGLGLAMSTGQKLVIPNFTGLNSASKFTYIGWLKSRTNTTPNGNSLLDRTAAFNLRTEIAIGTDSNFYIFPSESANYAYFSTPDITNYHQYVVVYDGTLTGNANRLKLYIDGVQKTLLFGGTIPVTIHASTANLNIGAGAYSTASINCNLIKTDLFNNARTQSDVNRDYMQFLLRH